jgi:cytochrome c551/c552
VSVQRILVAVVCLAAASGAATHSQAQAAEDPVVKRGRMLWSAKGCGACHVNGKRASGPDLLGLTQRRSRDWINRFMKDTEGMLATDSTAMALLKEWKGVKMPKAKLSDQEIDAILKFIASDEARPKP